MSQLICAACGREKRDDAAVICPSCERKTVRRLWRIPGLHAVLSGSAELKTPETSDEGRRAPGPTRGAPADLHALSLVDRRTDVRAVLSPWLDDIRERQNGQRPAEQGVGRVSVQELCERLASAIPWCVEHLEVCAELVSEVGHQHGLLNRAVVGERKPPAPVPCPRLLQEGDQCTGRLILHPDGAISCRVCESVWAFEEWQRLGGLLA